LLDALRNFHVIAELGEDHLHASKGDALSAVLPKTLPSVCATCTRRVFTECANLPAPEGIGAA